MFLMNLTRISLLFSIFGWKIWTHFTFCTISFCYGHRFHDNRQIRAFQHLLGWELVRLMTSRCWSRFYSAESVVQHAPLMLFPGSEFDAGLPIKLVPIIPLFWEKTKPDVWNEFFDEIWLNFKCWLRFLKQAQGRDRFFLNISADSWLLS